MGPAFLRKYGVASASGTHIRVPMPVFDDPNLFAGNGDWTPAEGDVKVSIDGGVEANIGTLPTFVNGAWQYVFTALELTGKTITVRIHDAAGDAVADQFILIETYGHASAMYAQDFSSIDIAGKVLGGGSGEITGVGVRAVDGSGNAIMPASAYTAPLDAAGIRAALGLSSANLDTQLGDLPTNAELAAALAVDGLSFASAMEVLLAVLAGVAVPSGSTVAFKKRDGSTTKLTITYGSADGERTASVIS